MGTLLHNLLACKSLAKSWIPILNTISEIIKIPVQPSPGLALLNVGIDYFPYQSRIVVTNTLLAARLVLMRHWKSSTPPSVQEVINTVHTLYTYETLFALSNGSYK